MIKYVALCMMLLGCGSVVGSDNWQLINTTKPKAPRPPKLVRRLPVVKQPKQPKKVRPPKISSEDSAVLAASSSTQSSTSSLSTHTSSADTQSALTTIALQQPAVTQQAPNKIEDRPQEPAQPPSPIKNLEQLMQEHDVFNPKEVLTKPSLLVRIISWFQD